MKSPLPPRGARDWGATILPTSMPCADSSSARFAARIGARSRGEHPFGPPSGLSWATVAEPPGTYASLLASTTKRWCFAPHSVAWDSSDTSKA